LARSCAGLLGWAPDRLLRANSLVRRRLDGGPAWQINPKWPVFGEYPGTQSSHEIKLESVGTLKADILTNAANIGLSYRCQVGVQSGGLVATIDGRVAKRSYQAARAG